LKITAVMAAASSASPPAIASTMCWCQLRTVSRSLGSTGALSMKAARSAASMTASTERVARDIRHRDVKGDVAVGVALSFIA
jgi:hypothetical protein